jgi:hypothetical protein
LRLKPFKVLRICGGGFLELAGNVPKQLTISAINKGKMPSLKIKSRPLSNKDLKEKSPIEVSNDGTSSGFSISLQKCPEEIFN